MRASRRSRATKSSARCHHFPPVFCNVHVLLRGRRRLRRCWRQKPRMVPAGLICFSSPSFIVQVAETFSLNSCGGKVRRSCLGLRGVRECGNLAAGSGAWTCSGSSGACLILIVLVTGTTSETDESSSRTWRRHSARRVLAKDAGVAISAPVGPKESGARAAPS